MRDDHASCFGRSMFVVFRPYVFMYRDKYEAEDRYVTRSEVYRIVCSELKPIVEEAIAKALAAKKSGDEK